ncbi:Histone-lysine N-methyltransferase,H3 lysine-79 specific [Schistosoma japonicum]|uniref:Histone-lysine N-methyltransferase, H3 lysine-79 specific n=1 Tax=Schistosoma japonicum TaxID=6182 RepID=A0A4Z2DX30_SCHJA|nr:Histone-lysine N-methyltransferase,H3 lysine-79 specific [Schistosoma japonicum]
MELLHEAAFGTSDSGCGLGYSLISPVDRIGSHLIDQINEYHSRAFVGEKCVLGIVHSRADVDGIDILKQVKSSINLNPPHLEASSDNHGFVGGEIRRDLIAASTVYAYLAWPSRGFWPVCDLIVCALNGSSNRIHHGGNASKSLLARTAIEGDIDTEAVAFHKVYSDHGLFGIAVAGSCPKTVGSRIKRIISVLRSANFTEENLKQAKQILRADLMFRYENPFHSLVDISTNLLSPTNQSVKPIEVVASVNKTDLKSFNDPGEIKDENSEIVDVISWIVSDVREMSENVILAKLLKETDRSSYGDVSRLCDVYNKTILDLWDMWMEANIVPEFFNRKASRDHIQFILLQCYNRAVSDPEKLNQYPPFSPQVYGETSFELISQMIDTITVASDDVFIDLGSGVGQVVLQVCACTDAKFCYGIEKADYPANCASRLDAAFRHWMSFYGKSYRPYALERGDFLSVEYQERITNASVLFANNFAFGPEVDYQLKQRFANLKEGARIISSKAFCPLNFRITDRNLGDIGSIMRVNCLTPIQDAVSWTDKPFSYYVHTIDRSLLEQYFARLKNPKFKKETNSKISGDIVSVQVTWLSIFR